jgi:hypothetical protein
MEPAAADLSEVNLGAEGSGNTNSTLPAYLEPLPGMLSFDSESSLCGHKLTTPIQVQVTMYTKDEDAKEIPSVEKQDMPEVEFERSEDAKEIHKIEKQVVTRLSLRGRRMPRRTSDLRSKS